MASETIRVTGLRELNRDLNRMNREVGKQVKRELKAAAEPVRRAAADLASSRIRNIGPKWAAMKVGATSSAVYIAPAARRGHGSPRPNLGGLLLKDAMLPALEQKSGEVLNRFDEIIDRVAREGGF